MKRKLCDRCEINNIEEGEEYCKICIDELKGKTYNGSRNNAERIPVDAYLRGKDKAMLSLYEQLHKEIENSCRNFDRTAWSTFIAYYKSGEKFVNGMEIQDKYIKIYLPFEPVGIKLNLQKQHMDSKDFHFHFSNADEIADVMKAIIFSYRKI